MAILNHKLLYWTVWDRFMQVLYLGRAPRTKETLPDFCEKCRVTRHSRVFRGLTGSQRTLGIWGVTEGGDFLPSLSTQPTVGSPPKMNISFFFFFFCLS